jgi:hypothetical protein
MGRKSVTTPTDDQECHAESSRNSPRKARASRSCNQKQRDAALTAAAAGWGTTFRYALLVLVVRGSTVAGAWGALEIIRYLGKLG